MLLGKRIGNSEKVPKCSSCPIPIAKDVLRVSNQRDGAAWPVQNVIDVVFDHSSATIHLPLQGPQT